MNPGESIVPEPDKESVVKPTAPDATTEPAPTTEAVSPLDVRPKTPVEDADRQGPPPAERGVPKAPLEATSDPRLEGVPGAEPMTGQEVGSTATTTEVKPEHVSFLKKIINAFRGKPKEPKVPTSVVNTEPSASSGTTGAEDANRQAAISNAAADLEKQNKPLVMTKEMSQGLPHGSGATPRPVESASPEADDQKKAA